MKFGEMQCKKAKIDPKIDSKIDFKLSQSWINQLISENIVGILIQMTSVFNI